MPEGPSPWERQHGETVRWYHAFCHFRDQKVHSCAVAYRTHKRECEKDPVPEQHGCTASLATLEFGVGLGGARCTLGC